MEAGGGVTSMLRIIVCCDFGQQNGWQQNQKPASILLSGILLPTGLGIPV
jgi:hypothetical protein